MVRAGLCVRDCVYVLVYCAVSFVCDCVCGAIWYVVVCFVMLCVCVPFLMRVNVLFVMYCVTLYVLLLLCWCARLMC